MKKILIVDDVAEVRRLVKLVAMHRHDVSEAADASEALAAMQRDPPDLVILDINMPGSMDGLQLLEAMRTDPALAATRVVMVTGRGLPSDRYFAATLNVAAYFVKPFSPLELADCVNNLLA